MARWPFRRRNKRERKQADDGITNPPHDEIQGDPHFFSATAETGNNSVVGGATSVTRRDSKRLKRESAPARTTTTNNNNNCNNNNNNLRRGDNDDISTALPVPAPSRRFFGTAFRSQSQSDVSNAQLRQPASTITSPQRHSTAPPFDPSMSQQSLSADQYPVPTLRVKKNGERNVLRRKSDRRRRSEQAREQEIRNMVEASASGSQTRRGAGNNNVAGNGPAQRSSSDAPDSRSFRISALDALIPRPILRYKKDRSYNVPQPTRELSKSSDPEGKRPAVVEKHMAENDRIDELADDMDARGLRELLERDRRRSMRSREAQEFLNKKLEQQQQAEQEREPSPILPPMPTRDWPLRAPRHSRSWLDNPSKEELVKPEPASKESAEWKPRQDAAVATASGAIAPVDKRASVASTSQFATSADQSMSDLSRSLKPEKRNSGLQLARSALGGLFRRTSSRMKKRFDANEQSTSSVQSKESSFTKTQPVQPAQPPDIEPAPVVPPKSTLRNTATAGSSHGTSKFTEHLNDFPMPPTTVAASGGQSGAVSAMRAPSGDGSGYKNNANTNMNAGVGTIDRYSISAKSTLEGGDERTTGENSSPEPRPDSMLLAQSLASIDSEASWLSGKPSRRISEVRKNHLIRTPGSTSRERLDESAAESGEGDGDEIFGRMSMADDEGQQEDKLTESNMSSKTERAEDGKPAAQQARSDKTPLPLEIPLQASVSKQPQLVNQVAPQRSTEGLFTNYQESGPGSPSSAEGNEEVEPQVQRATSIDFGKGHVRQISAGSAKVVEVSSSRRPSQARTIESAESKPDPE